MMWVSVLVGYPVDRVFDQLAVTVEVGTDKSA
jgi:hypothetical protein